MHVSLRHGQPGREVLQVGADMAIALARSAKLLRTERCESEEPPRGATWEGPHGVGGGSPGWDPSEGASRSKIGRLTADAAPGCSGPAAALLACFGGLSDSQTADQSRSARIAVAFYEVHPADLVVPSEARHRAREAIPCRPSQSRSPPPWRSRRMMRRPPLGCPPPSSTASGSSGAD